MLNGCHLNYYTLAAAQEELLNSSICVHWLAKTIKSISSGSSHHLAVPFPFVPVEGKLKF